MQFRTANLGRHVGVREFIRNLRVVLGNMRAVIGLQEIDEADAPKEHKIIWFLTGAAYRRVGWKTRTPILVPRALFRVLDGNVIRASAGVPKQSPARQVVWARYRRRGKKNRNKVLNHFNTHFPRNARVLDDERADVMRVLKKVVQQCYDRGETSIITTDANGMDMMDVHPGAKRIGGRGIDWIVLVPHPQGTQVDVTSRFTRNLTIDGHDLHGVVATIRSGR